MPDNVLTAESTSDRCFFYSVELHFFIHLVLSGLRNYRAERQLCSPIIRNYSSKWLIYNLEIILRVSENNSRNNPCRTVNRLNLWKYNKWSLALRDEILFFVLALKGFFYYVRNVTKFKTFSLRAMAREFSIDVLEEMLENSGLSLKKGEERRTAAWTGRAPGKISTWLELMKAVELTRKSYWVLALLRHHALVKTPAASGEI